MNTMISISGLFKARPAEEGGERLLYLEASNEGVDLQGERVLAKCLEDSAAHFLRYGNLDIDHRTQQRPSPGDNPYQWEIGQPREVRVDGPRTFVKAVLYQGDGPLASNANLVWDSLTRLNPPARWYPSVAGQFPRRETVVDPVSQVPTTHVVSVLWTNIGLSKTPVNDLVPPAATVPVGVFAKCLTADGCLDLGKALEAGYGTDSATLTDGAAVRRASIDARPQSTTAAPAMDVRDTLAALVRKRRGLTPAQLTAIIADVFHFQPDEAARWVERFLRDVRAHRHGATR